MTDDAERELRAARRAFVRTQHPDAGGDPAAFAAGLRRFDERLAALNGTSGSRPSPPLPVVPSRRLDRVVGRAIRRALGRRPRRNLL